jgi:hypothetical protein
MQKGGPTRLGAFLLVLVVIALVVGGIVWLVRTLGGDDKTTVATESAGVVALTNVKDASGVRMLVRGPITAPENQRSYAIEIRPTARTMTTYRGYDGTVIRTETLPNDKAAYTELSFALKRAGMMNRRELTDAARELRGICANGTLYQFETLDGDKVVESLFAATCDLTKGSFAGLLPNVQRLFFRQIPNIGDMRREAKL